LPHNAGSVILEADSYEPLSSAAWRVGAVQGADSKRHGVDDP